MINGQTLREINFNVNIVAAILGITINIFLILLLLSIRKSELKNYNKLILQIAITDIFDSIIMVIVMPVGCVIEGREFFFQNGFFKSAPQPWNHVFILLWQFVHFFSFSTVPIQFIYRFLLLCKNKKITNKLFASLFLIPFLISLTQIVIAHFTTFPNLNLKPEIIQELSQYFNSNNTNELLIGAGGEHSSFDMILVNITATILISTSYIVIFYCGLKINAYLKSSSKFYTPKTAQMHQSLIKVLFFQAISPIFFLFAPTFAILVFSFTRATTPPEFFLLSTVDGWPPFINAFSAMITLKPLRRKILKIFRKNVDTSLASDIPKISVIRNFQHAATLRRYSCVGVMEHLNN